MADNTIDSLQLEISADANIAEKSLNRLADSLIKLQSSVGALGNGQFQNLANGIRQLSDSMERFTGSVKTADFTRIATGLNKLSSVNVQGVSDASRAISTLTANLSQIGAIAFDSQGIANIASAIAQLGRKTVTQATANIPALTTALSGLISGVEQMGTIDFDSTGLSELVSAISKLGGKTATAAANGNITKLAAALKEMMTTLSTAPKVSQNLIQITQALAQFAVAGGRAGTATTSLARGFNILPTSTAKAKKGFSGLAGAIGKFYATYWLLIRGLGQFKKAIDISSDLTEVQNVVDVTFGNMADTMNKFASSALQNYGMSELMAKDIASRFQAMGVAMGFAQEPMSEMSIRLTELTGDLASFYNLTQENVAKKLQSIFTGETEPLRALGLDLSFATVEAWALSQGIEADMQKMTQAQKTLLRYQYVLANTGAATGDFQRTINSWHNQLVLLSGAFQQLGSIIGGTLINAFKPFIQALNSVMGAVINFAQVVSDALGAIFGWEYQVGGGVADDMEYGAGAAEDMEDALGGAAKKAKDLNRYIAGWHEVNNMTSDEDSKGSGSGSGAGAGSGAADGGQWLQTESLWEKYTSDIDSLYALGSYISGVLTDAMNDIDWDSIYEKAENFGSGLAEFLNGLINPELFGGLGTTIAGALNTALHALDSFGTEFDWVNFGNSIAAGVNDFFDTFDFGLLANTLNTWANGILDSAIEFIDQVHWEDIGTEIGGFLEDLNFTEVGNKIGKLIWNAINAGIAFFKGMFKAAPIETAVIAAIGILKFTGLGKILSGKIASAIMGSFSMPSIIAAIGKVFSGTAIGTAIAKALSASTIVTTIRATMAETGASITTILWTYIATPITNFFTKTLPGAVGKLGISLPTVGLVAGSITALAIAFDKLEESYLEDVADKISGWLAEIGVAETVQNLQNSADSLGNLADGISEVQESINTDNAKIDDLVKKYMTLADQSELTATQQLLLKDYAGQLLSLVPELSDVINSQTGEFSGNKDAVYEAVEAHKKYAEAMVYQNLISQYNAELAKAEIELQANADKYDLCRDRLDKLNEVMSTTERGSHEQIEKLKEMGSEWGVTFDTWEQANEYAGALEEGMNTCAEAENNLTTSMEDSSRKMDLANQKYNEVSGALDAMNQRLAEIDITLPEQIVQTLLNGETSVQDATIQMLSAISTGYSAKESELTKLFKNLGITLPEKLTSALAGKDSEVQKQAVETIGKLKEGVEASDDEILNLFSTLGDDSANKLIGALEDSNKDTYDQTISLLGQLLIAEEAERPDIISRLNQLGIDASGIYNAGLGSNNDEIRETAETMVSNTKQPVEDAFSDTQSGDMYNAGANASKGFWQGLQDWWDDSILKGLIDGVKRTITGADGLDEHSPSRVFWQYGAYAIMGFNEGLEDEIPNTYDLVENWMDGILGQFDGKTPVIDVSVDTSKYQFKPASIDLGKVNGQIEEELSYLFGSDGLIDYDRLGEAMYEAQDRAMKENPLQVGDDQIFGSVQKSVKRFGRQTGKNPWPVYAR